MRFAQAYFAFCFWIILGLAAFIMWAFRRKRSAMNRFAEPELLNQLALAVNFKRQRLKYIIIITALIFTILALMRPQWGFQWQEVKRRGLDILIAIDTSKSMLATDMKPNRLMRSKLAVKDLIKKLKGDRIGLIAFSGSSFLQCPLTVDYNGFLLALNDLNTGTIPMGGTNISSAMRLAAESYEGDASKYKILVIITDGEDHQGESLRLAEELKKQGIKVFCVGVGTKEGDLIQIVDRNGKRSFLKDKKGNVVKSRLNEEVLQRIALTTGGTYVRSSGAEFGLDLIYEERLSKMEKREIKAQMSKLYYERFQIPLFIALLFLIIEPFINDRKKR